MIYVGGGCAEAAAEVLAVAERLQAPVVTYTGGKGIVSDRHYLAQNLLAGHELWRERRCRAGGRHALQPAADPLGSRRRHKVIRIDLDPVEISRNARAGIGIVADAKAALGALRRELERHGARARARMNLTR